MKKILSAFILLFAVMNWSCESPLSNQPVSDPSSLQPIIQVIKEIDYKGTLYHRYRADIYDHQHRYVEIKDGGIKVNNENMTVVKDILGTYYSADDQRVPYNFNTKYNFTVTLSDLSQYNATVTTHSVDLYNFITPSEQIKTQDLSLSWKDTDPNATMYINIAVYYTADTTSGVQMHSVNIPNPSSGSFILPAADLQTENGTPYSADLTLNSEVEGTIDSRFYINRRAYSHQMITKSIVLK
jgi:hypothetical protein